MKNVEILNTTMNIYHPACRRVAILHRTFSKSSPIELNYLKASYSTEYTGEKLVKISDVSKIVKPAKSPVYIPVNYVKGEPTQFVLKHLRWMLQKDLLGQDMFLIGRPGPLRRHLAMQFMELTDRELEYISLSRDTTEADLKQRREIKDGTAVYFDQSAVRAAIHGRILVLEGIEKAERNVLPILNNLLENREMHLEDGRFLIPAKRYDKLLKENSQEELDRWKLVRVSEDFRVIALGLPVPRYVGNPLDPPLRSRFQARDISGLPYKEQMDRLREISPNSDPAQVSQLLSCCHALLSQESWNLGLPDFPADNLPAAVMLLDSITALSTYDAIYRLYPYNSFLGPEGQAAVENVLDTFQIANTAKHPLKVTEVASGEGSAKIHIDYGSQLTDIQVPCGSQTERLPSQKFVPTQYQEDLVTHLILSHRYKDMCVIGPRGCGKSATILRFADILHYDVETIVLYQDMTSRDLIQQRTTLLNGDTVWRDSSLITAALEGKLAVLDGLHRIHSSTIAVLQRLVHDRELTLYDGRRLLHHERFDECKRRHDLSDKQMREAGILRIHPAFRIVALAEPPVQGNSRSQWLSSEMLSLFMYHEMRPLGLEEETHLVKNLYGSPDERFLQVIKAAHEMRKSEDPALKMLAGSFSTRQLLRIARRMTLYEGESAANAIKRACLARFLPTVARQALDRFLADRGLDTTNDSNSVASECRIDGDFVLIGNTKFPRYQTPSKAKVPDILFYNVPQHIQALEWLLQDFCLGEHLLLIGNQGVGKNKLADRLLQLLNRPREYIQLHRDTTVQTLTLQPTVRDGVLIYEDSPLVQAVKLGHVLIVDEADKAPTHVTCILKTLVESGEMVLFDGRRIVSSDNPLARKNSPNLIPIHPDFRMIVLANRPGFPFLGNDFFGALGDLFSCHAVDNPDAESEHSLLKQYGPDVPDKIISRLVKAFGELRNMADEGLVQYPYSTREVVNIVKHLQEFPNESLVNAIGNVFDFDGYNQEVIETLEQTLQKHGIPVHVRPDKINLAKELPLPPPRQAAEWRVQHPSPPTVLSVEERFIKASVPEMLRQTLHLLSVTEPRGSAFSEMQSYFTVPVGEAAVISGLGVCKSLDDDPLKDWIHVLTINPLSLYSMQASGKEILELSLQGFFSQVRGSRPCFKLVPLKRGSTAFLIHEETSNSLVLVDPSAGILQPLPLTSTLEQVASMFSGKLQLNPKLDGWKLSSDLLEDFNLLVVSEKRGSKIDIVNMEAMRAFTISLPLTLKSVHLVSPHQWLIEDSDNKKYLLGKADPLEKFPRVLLPIEENGDMSLLSSLSAFGMQPLEPPLLSRALQKKIEAPNRVFASALSSGAVAVGFPDLELSANQVYVWPRLEEYSSKESSEKTLVLPRSGQIIRPVSANNIPDEIRTAEKNRQSSVAGYLEITDIINQKVRYIPVPQPQDISPVTAWMYSVNQLPVFVAPTSNEGVVTVDAGGCVRLWETDLVNLEKSLQEWKQIIGNEREYLQMTKERFSGEDVTAPKHGKVDETGAPHVGGNTWAGGTGGRDTAGLGGKGGPYRLDAGHTVHQLSDEEKADVPEHVKEAAREMARKAFQKKLKEIQMSEYDSELYNQLFTSVKKQVQALRVILGSLQAKSKERQWLRHQTSGELDDTKLIEGLTGEKTIYKRRAEKEPELGTPQMKPKRLRIIVDVSGSMYRFNGYDGRLDREMEAVVMVMEACEGFENQIVYDIVGHSGEDYNLVFVDPKMPPTDRKKRLEIIKTMHAHSQYCMSGDHTLAATKYGVSSISKEECDEAIVIVLSDANLTRYGISPERFAKILTSEQSVSAFAIFVGSLGDEAARLTKKLPAGRAFVCLDLKNLPNILHQVFTTSLLNNQ